MRKEEGDGVVGRLEWKLKSYTKGSFCAAFLLHIYILYIRKSRVLCCYIYILHVTKAYIMFCMDNVLKSSKVKCTEETHPRRWG